MTEGRAGRPTILLIEEDDETRSVLVPNLRGQGYRVVAALDEEDALARADGGGLRADGGGLRADLVLVNLVMKPLAELLRVERLVRERMGLGGETPLVVMPERYGKDVEGTNVNVEGRDWVVYLGEESGQLHDLLAQLLA